MVEKESVRKLFKTNLKNVTLQKIDRKKKFKNMQNLEERKISL